MSPAIGWRTEIEPVAVKGARLALIRQTYRDAAEDDRPVTVELLTVLEVDGDGLIRDVILFDPGDIDAACEELDARHVEGEPADAKHAGGR